MKTPRYTYYNIDGSPMTTEEVDKHVFTAFKNFTGILKTLSGIEEYYIKREIVRKEAFYLFIALLKLKNIDLESI